MRGSGKNRENRDQVRPDKREENRAGGWWIRGGVTGGHVQK